MRKYARYALYALALAASLAAGLFMPAVAAMIQDGAAEAVETAELNEVDIVFSSVADIAESLRLTAERGDSFSLEGGRELTAETAADAAVSACEYLRQLLPPSFAEAAFAVTEAEPLLIRSADGAVTGIYWRCSAACGDACRMELLIDDRTGLFTAYDITAMCDQSVDKRYIAGPAESLLDTAGWVTTKYYLPLLDGAMWADAEYGDNGVAMMIRFSFVYSGADTSTDAYGFATDIEGSQPDDPAEFVAWLRYSLTDGAVLQLSFNDIG